MTHAQRRAGERGQALVEAGIVITIVIMLTLGIIEFGRAFMVINMITNAARDGARIAAVVKASDRNATGIINAGVKTTIQNQIKTEIRSILSASDASALNVTVDQPPPVGGVNVVTARVNGTVPYIFRLAGTTFSVDRLVTFRDEGR